MAPTLIVPAISELLTAVELLRAGELVAFPTETVYGLGADARSAEAVAKIYAAKGRPAGNPLIVHAADFAAAQRYAEFSDVAITLAKQFWPGPLTLVLPRKDTITPLVSAGRSTVAIRIPKHPVAEALLNLLDGPIAAPSANRSNFTSPTTAQHVYAELRGRISLILDGGPCSVGLESTVLDLTTTVPTILRPGVVTREMLQSILGNVNIFEGHVPVDAVSTGPGMHDRHYAPRTPAFYFSNSTWHQRGGPVSRFANLTIKNQKQPAVLITYDPAVSLRSPHETIVLPADAEGYARSLYAALRSADEKHPSLILVLMPGTQDGMWAAVGDRLHRAAQPLPIL